MASEGGQHTNSGRKQLRGSFVCYPILVCEFILLIYHNESTSKRLIKLITYKLYNMYDEMVRYLTLMGLMVLVGVSYTF